MLLLPVLLHIAGDLTCRLYGNPGSAKGKDRRRKKRAKYLLVDPLAIVYINREPNSTILNIRRCIV